MSKKLEKGLKGGEEWIILGSMKTKSELGIRWELLDDGESGRVKEDAYYYGAEGAGGAVIARALVNILRDPAPPDFGRGEVIGGGLPFTAFESLRDWLGVTAARLAEVLRIPKSTLAVRNRRGRLSELESDRLLRLARTFQAVFDEFEDLEATRRWFLRPKRALGMRVPLEECATDLGAERVRDLVVRVADTVVT